GLLITLAKISAHYDLGLEAKIDVSNAQLFSESQGRYIISVKENESLNIENAIEIGQFNDGNQFVVSNNQTTIIKNVADIKDVWEGAISQCLTTQD
ncbi:MAG: phosphoribosylformylglycinamidine synthase II, partial [Staphylococcus warneri]|nr:phosphoribosylformylglycinamidine synthase II [Staphylococcus warneri]